MLIYDKMGECTCSDMSSQVRIKHELNFPFRLALWFALAWVMDWLEIEVGTQAVTEFKVQALGFCIGFCCILLFTFLFIVCIFEGNAVEYCLVLIKYIFCSLHKSLLCMLHASNSSKVRFKVKGYINSHIYAIQRWIKGNISHNCG